MRQKPPRRRLGVKRLALLSSLAGLCPAAAAATGGGIVQPRGRSGCISEDGAGRCADGRALGPGVDAVAISADGKSVYATPFSGVAHFERKGPTGAIMQPDGKAGCVTATGAGHCGKGRGLKKGADSVAVSPDGKYVYVAAYTSSAVDVFKRNAKTGAIHQLTGPNGCISEDGAGSCAQGHGLSGVAWLTVSADGKSVYAASTVS